MYLLIDKCPQIASNLASFSSMFLTVCCCSVKENRKYVLHYIFLGLVIDRKFKKKLYTNFVVNFLFESDASEIYKFNKQISLLSNITQASLNSVFKYILKSFKNIACVTYNWYQYHKFDFGI